MTENELRDFLGSNKEEIQRAVKQKMVDSLVATHRWEISEQIGKVVNEFMAAEIMPLVRDHLKSEKGAIVEAAISSANQIGQMLAEQMVKKAAENMKGYGFTEVMKGVFR